MRLPSRASARRIVQAGRGPHTVGAPRRTGVHARRTRGVMADGHERTAMDNELSRIVETLPGPVSYTHLTLPTN